MKNTKASAFLFGSIVALAWAQASLAQDTAPQAAESDQSYETVKTDDGAIIVTAKRFVPSGAITASKTTAPLIETP